MHKINDKYKIDYIACTTLIICMRWCHFKDEFFLLIFLGQYYAKSVNSAAVVIAKRPT